MVDIDKVLALHQAHTGVLDIKSDLDITTRGDLAEAYTPGVAELAKLIKRDPEAKQKYTISGKLVAVITDGSAVLGLGNIGPAAGLPIVEGKALLYKNFAQVDAIPMCLNQVPISEFVQTVKNMSLSFAGIHLEDIAAPRCFEIEEQLSRELSIPVYHDDQTGTAIVVAAGLINAAKLAHKDLKDLKIIINGVGAAGAATARLLLAMGIKQLTLIDIYGKITPTGSRYNNYQRNLSAQCQQVAGSTLNEVIEGQDVFVGLSDAKALSGEQVSVMADKAIVFALANPVPEIDPDEAHKNGAYITATGSAQWPNQVNNVLAFPGLFKGLLAARLTSVDFELQQKVAEALAEMVETPEIDRIIPNVFEKGVVDNVYKAVMDYAKNINHG